MCVRIGEGIDAPLRPHSNARVDAHPRTCRDGPPGRLYGALTSSEVLGKKQGFSAQRYGFIRENPPDPRRSAGNALSRNSEAAIVELICQIVRHAPRDGTNRQSGVFVAC